MNADPQPSSVAALLDQARSGLARLTPAETLRAIERGDVLIDIRPLEQRRRDGAIPGAHVVSRNVLEWRLDPQSAHRDPALARTDCRVIVICDEGFQSSLAAATLRRFGLDATDVIGGFREWLLQGLPMTAADPG